MNDKFKRIDMDFYSNQTRCSAWLYLPHLDKKCPVIVMAHGLGGLREMRFDAYAERFASAGYACLLFDYRNFGASDGNQRQRINVKEQLEDWNCAIDFIKKSDLVDRNKILLFGSSLSGGHVITLSAKRNDIVATISQCPYTSTFATIGAIPLLSALKMSPLIVADIASCMTGYHPVMIKLGDAPGKAALMPVPDYKTFFRLVPKGSHFENRAPGRTVLEFFKYAPGKYAKNVDTPIYYAVCMKDTIAPAKKTLEYAKESPKSAIKKYNCGHFDIYLDEDFESAIVDYIDFFNKNTK